MCTDRAMQRAGKRRQGGLTLIELVIFLVIVSVAVAGILGVLSFTNRNSADPQTTKQALAIAEGLMEEVQLARFTYCDPLDANAEIATSAAGCASLPEVVGPEAGNTRPYDNVNDYVTAFGVAKSFSSTANANDINDAAGTTTSTAINVTDATHVLGNYTASVTMNVAGISLGPTGSAVSATPPANQADVDVVQIIIKVSYGGNKSVTLEGYRTRYAPNAIP